MPNIDIIVQEIELIIGSDRKTSLELTIDQETSLALDLNVVKGIKGDKGDTGERGFSGNIDEYRASGDIGQYRLLTVDNTGKVVHASSNNNLNINKIVGMSQNSATNGELVLATYYGRVRNPQWNLDTNKAVFVGLDGNITQDPFTGVFTQEVGFAVSNTEIYINIKHGILRI